jgi:hypothetical protein
LKYTIDQISGNSFYVILVPVNAEDEHLLKEGVNDRAIEHYYRQAIEETFPDGIKIASLTPNDDFPYSATIETFSISGSV